MGTNVRMVAGLGMLLLVAICWPAPTHAQQRPVDVWITQSDPGLSAELGPGDTLYVRLGYRSDRPVRFRMEGFAGRAGVVNGAMDNVAPPHPPGEGEALVWIAYRQPVRIDEIRITALDGKWQPLQSFSAVVDLGWGTAGSPQRRAEWVDRMSREQQEAARHQIEQQDSSGGAVLFFLLVGGVLGYFVLQPLTVMRFDGGWRIAALVPLLATGPLLVHAGLAFAAGGNLWPILLIFCLPAATLYLLALAGVRSLATEYAAT